MSELAVAAQSGSSPVTTMLRRTVAVVDMVGYSDVARMLEQNISALSVADLNRQIQSFITRSLDRLPNQHGFCVVSRPGDGIILLFEQADDAHKFACHVHLFAAEHNNERSESTAERWFRIGIATGDVTSTACADQAPDFAGITIANAVRLESKAKSGEILIDLTTFDLLPSETRLLYASGRDVPGKRKELFRARSFRVSCPRVPSRISTHPLMSRRVFLGTAAATVASGTLAAWLERDRLYAHLHPLPNIRHIALMAWPPPAKESEAMLAGIIDSIHARLIHAEAYTQQFMIVTAEEVARSFGPSSPVAYPGRSPQEAADQWGANLILAANLSQYRTAPTLLLRVFDTTGGKLYRQDRLPLTATGVSEAASDSAARLLDLPLKELQISDEKELANQPEAARSLYSEASLLAKDQNHAKTADAIQKFLDLAQTYPNFSLAHSGLGGQYLYQYRKGRNPTDRDFADRNSGRALELNPNSEAGRLVRAKFLLTTGQPEKAHDLLAAILRADPMNTEAAFTLAQVFQQTGHPDKQEAVYRDLIRNRPNCWLAYNDLGNLFHNRGKDDQALDCYRQASALAANTALPLRNLGTSYLLLNRSAEAKAAYERSIVLAPNETAFENLGNLAFKAKDYPKALRLYLQAQSLATSNFYVLADLGDTYERLNQPEKTRDCYRKGAQLLAAHLRVNPQSAYEWMTLAFYHAKIHDNRVADQDVLTSEQHGPLDTATTFLKARTLMLLNRTQLAEATVLKCLDMGLSIAEVELAPEFDTFRENSAYIAKAHNAKAS